MGDKLLIERNVDTTYQNFDDLDKSFTETYNPQISQGAYETDYLLNATEYDNVVPLEGDMTYGKYQPENPDASNAPTPPLAWGDVFISFHQLRGIVQSVDGKPVEGAMVYLTMKGKTYSTATVSGGAFTFNNIASSTDVTIVVEHPNYERFVTTHRTNNFGDDSVNIVVYRKGESAPQKGFDKNKLMMVAGIGMLGLAVVGVAMAKKR